MAAPLSLFDVRIVIVYKHSAKLIWVFYIQRQNRYLAVGRGRVQKFRPRPGANPAHVVGQARVLGMEVRREGA